MIFPILALIAGAVGRFGRLLRMGVHGKGHVFVRKRNLAFIVRFQLGDRRLNLLLFAMLGSLALVLAVIGVYGVVAYSVEQRTHEIGVRMAIGARPADVQRMVLVDGGRLAIAGVAIGTVLALVSARVLRGLLFHVSASDPATFVAVGTALMVVATLASYIPARRATRVDPMVALRN